MTGEHEDDFQRALIDVARTLGYRVAHFRAAKTSKGWRTPVAADGAGWPDLAIVGRGRVIFAELKSANGRLRDDQAAWLEWLIENGQEAYCWRPDDWPQILAVLTGKKAREVAA